MVMKLQSLQVIFDKALYFDIKSSWNCKDQGENEASVIGVVNLWQGLVIRYQKLMTL